MDDEMGLFKLMMQFQVAIAGVAVVLFLIGAISVWFVAPEVGGEWWPYVRVGVAVIGGVLAAKVGVVVSGVVVFAVMSKKMGF